jgi:hypothetical protein
MRFAAMDNLNTFSNKGNDCESHIQQCNGGRQALGDECHEDCHREGEGLRGLALVNGSDAHKEEHNSEDDCNDRYHHNEVGATISDSFSLVSL